MQRILITGGNGLLGQKLITLLATRPGVQVLATGQGALRAPMPALADGATFSWQPLDVTDQAAVADALAAFRPTSVIHTAAMTNVDQCETHREACRALNVDAVGYISAACAAMDAHLVHLSTDFIFDGAAGPYDEDVPAAPLSFYGHSKADAEAVVLSTPGLRAAIVRTILVYGQTPGQSRSNIIIWVRSSLEAGKKIQVVDDQWRTPTLAEDLAWGSAELALRELTGVYNIGGPDLLTPYEMAMRTAAFFNLDASLIERVDGTIFTQPARRPPRTGLVIDKARAHLGYNPRTFEEGIRVMVGE